MRHALRSSLIAALLLAPAAAHSAPPSNEAITRQQAEEAERARAAEQAAQQQAAARAAAAAAEERALADQRVAAAAKLRQAEADTEAAASRMDALIRQRRDAEAKLAARAEEMQPLLPLIERLSLYPAETLLAVPAPPEETLRGVMVLRGIAQQLQQEAAALREEQKELDVATRAVREEAPKLAAAEATQHQEAEELDAEIATASADRQQAEADAQAAAARAADQAAKAENLRAMLTTLETQRRANEARAHEEAARAEHGKQGKEVEAARQREQVFASPAGAGTIAAAAQPKGQLTAPVEGNIVHSWGEPTEAGPATGISYHAAPAARVVSPCGGRVAFAAPFRSYGLLLIVDCGGGYHAVLAGFEHLDANVGQSVRQGEPVGVMPTWEPGSGSRPSLYIELRHQGQPVNPAPWLRASG